MEDEAAFIRAIAEDPDDDTIRLAYANWLDERGQSSRAEFIRVQIELARSPGHPDQASLRTREAELLKSHERTWAPNNALCLFFEWRRGFVTALHPAARGVFNGEDSLKLLAEFPLAEELQIGFCLTDAEFRHLPVMPNLRSLSLSGNVRLTNDAIRRVGRWKTLRRLRLTGRGVNDITLSHLVGLSELRELDISFSAVTDAGLFHLAGLRALEHLDVSETGITGRGLFALGGIPRLRRLNLVNTCYSDTGLSELGGCRALEELRLGSQNLLQPIGEADIRVLQGLPGLRVLDLGSWGEVSDGLLASVRERLPAVEILYAGQRHADPAAAPDAAHG